MGLLHRRFAGGVLEPRRDVWIALVCGADRGTRASRPDTPGPCMARKPSRGCREHRRVSAPFDQVARRCWQLCLGISDDDSPIGGRDCPSGPALRITSHRRPSPALALDSVLSCSSLARYASRGSVQVGREHAKRRGYLRAPSTRPTTTVLERQPGVEIQRVVVRGVPATHHIVFLAGSVELVVRDVLQSKPRILPGIVLDLAHEA